jgi:hypothetical protein
MHLNHGDVVSCYLKIIILDISLIKYYFSQNYDTRIIIILGRSTILGQSTNSLKNYTTTIAK